MEANGKATPNAGGDGRGEILADQQRETDRALSEPAQIPADRPERRDFQRKAWRAHWAITRPWWERPSIWAGRCHLFPGPPGRFRSFPRKRDRIAAFRLRSERALGIVGPEEWDGDQRRLRFPFRACRDRNCPGKQDFQKRESGRGLLRGHEFRRPARSSAHRQRSCPAHGVCAAMRTRNPAGRARIRTERNEAGTPARRNSVVPQHHGGFK